MSTSSSRAVSEKNTQQTELKEEEFSIEKASQKTWNAIIGGISFVVVVTFLCFLKRKSDNKALIIACEDNNLIAVTRLANKLWVNVNAKNEYGKTPLHLACYQGYYLIIKQLLSHLYINVNATDDKNETSLHLAVLNNEIEIVKLLLGQDNIDVSLMSDWSETPLSIARNQGYKGIVQLLNKKIEEQKNPK